MRDGLRKVRIDLLVQGGQSTDAPLSALRFARAALAAGHRIGRVFFYKDAVAVGSRFHSDEDGARRDWAALASERGFELAICIAAGARRGIVEGESVQPGFAIVGLGQLIEAMEEADRLVAF